MEYSNNQRCPDCGFVPEAPAKYCRQCGRPFNPESNTTTTDKQTQKMPGVNARSSNDDAQASVETEHFYKPPTPLSFSKPSAGLSFKSPSLMGKKSNAGVWIVGALLILVIAGSSIIGNLVSYVRPILNVKNTAADEIKAKAMAEAIEALKTARINSGNAAKDASVFRSTREYNNFQAIAESFKYPGAEITKSVNLGKTAMVVMETNDSVSAVKDFYVSKVGDPSVYQSKTAEEKRESVIFRLKDHPGFQIIIDNDGQSSDQQYSSGTTRNKTVILIQFIG